MFFGQKPSTLIPEKGMPSQLSCSFQWGIMSAERNVISGKVEKSEVEKFDFG